MRNLEYRNWILKHLSIGKEILYLTQDEVRSLKISDEKVIDLTERAIALYSKKEVEMPAKIGIHPLKDTLMHAMPCDIPVINSCGIKWGACFPTNRERFGLPQTSVLYILNDRESGYPISIMDAIWITERRTAAVSVISAKYLGNKNATTFGMIGCGVQGIAHVEMMPLVLPNLKKIYIYDIFEEAMDSLKKIVQLSNDIEIVKTKSFEEITKKSEILASATKITERPEPKIKDEWISKGQTIIMCDVHFLFEDKTMKRADKYLCDSVEQHELLKHYGYYPYGLPEIYSETGGIVAGLKKGRESDDELIVVNNVGMAVEDIMLAKEIFTNAIEKGIGNKLYL